MTGPSDQAPLARGRDEAAERLRAQGFAEAAIDPLLDFETASFIWSRMIAKGELLSTILSRLQLGVEPAQFHGLTAVVRLQAGVGRPAAEPTVGLLAGELAVDPSRASRIAADLVAAGFVQRGASPGDGRRSVLALTEKGEAVLQAVRAEKWRALAQVFDGWTPEEIAGFAAQVRRYAQGLQAATEAMQAEAGAPPQS
ncbi:MarR family winged helix-turn-helix transcriptional regulator [Pseudoroseicyclus aestuarii]|uniref:DNA-binding MarR family transcriptional regulator n=1 Tax=Pseudoroseicyclus aestuarii TaxID=1795041 RepID=A0A318T5K0_9RHOB|nr:MarR family transcriptional regulator [Pseudoroseicyclus aestuarii]PYE85664.1 DNA-binding MarR family transcriptional regulator [Pseudoroseicyclus aestuarii]